MTVRSVLKIEAVFWLKKKNLPRCESDLNLHKPVLFDLKINILLHAIFGRN